MVREVYPELAEKGPAVCCGCSWLEPFWSAHGSVTELLGRSNSLLPWMELLLKMQRRFAVLGELVLLRLAAGSVRQIAIGLSAQLVSRGLDCSQQLQCGRELRSFLLVRGLAGAQVNELSGWMSFVLLLQESERLFLRSFFGVAEVVIVHNWLQVFDASKVA